MRQQKLEAIERERLRKNCAWRVLFNKTLLPQELPQLAGWHVDAYYQPARAVGGDFYDFVYFADGRIAFIVADVTDKGVPAALVMATTRSILRAAAERLESPGAVLERTNNVLVKEIPPKMFVTCFVALLDPKTGHLRYANAGHDVPYHYTAAGVVELRATGMPLGLMPGMFYDEKETTLAAGDYFLLYSDGLVEAHAPDREMFGFPRLQKLLQTHADGSNVNDFLLAQLADFTGSDWEQEDDVTLVTVLCEQLAETPDQWRLLTQFDLPSQPGNERQAMRQVADVTAEFLPVNRLEKLKTAVAEATMNAMEHGNLFDPQKAAHIEVACSESAVRVRISDQGAGAPPHSVALPDLNAKLAGLQSSRGWGLFLIENMVDEMRIEQDENSHTIELLMQIDTQQDV